MKKKKIEKKKMEKKKIKKPGFSVSLVSESADSKTNFKIFFNILKFVLKFVKNLFKVFVIFIIICGFIWLLFYDLQYMQNKGFELTWENIRIILVPISFLFFVAITFALIIGLVLNSIKFIILVISILCKILIKIIVICVRFGFKLIWYVIKKIKPVWYGKIYIEEEEKKNKEEEVRQKKERTKLLNDFLFLIKMKSISIEHIEKVNKKYKSLQKKDKLSFSKKELNKLYNWELYYEDKLFLNTLKDELEKAKEKQKKDENSIIFLLKELYLKIFNRKKYDKMWLEMDLLGEKVSLMREQLKKVEKIEQECKNKIE